MVAKVLNTKTIRRNKPKKPRKRKPLTQERKNAKVKFDKAWQIRKLTKKKIDELSEHFENLLELKKIVAETEEGYDYRNKVLNLSKQVLDVIEMKPSGAKLKIPKLTKEKYLFCWDNVPGDDNGLLMNFLKQNVNINWVDGARIEKTDDGRTIRVLKGIKSLSFELYELIIREHRGAGSISELIVKLKIDGNEAKEFITKIENGKLNIYKGEKEEVPYGFEYEYEKPKRLFRLLRDGRIIILKINTSKLKQKDTTNIYYKDDEGNIIIVNKGTLFEGDHKETEFEFNLIELLRSILKHLPANEVKALIDEIEKSDATDRVNDATCGSQTELEEKWVCNDKTKCPKAQNGDFCSALNLNRALEKLHSKYLGGTENLNL